MRSLVQVSHVRTVMCRWDTVDTPCSTTWSTSILPGPMYIIYWSHTVSSDRRYQNQGHCPMDAEHFATTDHPDFLKMFRCWAIQSSATPEESLVVAARAVRKSTPPDGDASVGGNAANVSNGPTPEATPKRKPQGRRMSTQQSFKSTGAVYGRDCLA